MDCDFETIHSIHLVDRVVICASRISVPSDSDDVVVLDDDRTDVGPVILRLVCSRDRCAEVEFSPLVIEAHFVSLRDDEDDQEDDDHSEEHLTCLLKLLIAIVVLVIVLRIQH
jgi:hypothetical protein